MNRKTRSRLRALIVVLAAAVVGGVAGCGGGGGDTMVRPSPPPQQLYGAAAYASNDNCESIGLIGTQFSSATAAEQATRTRCDSDAQTLAAQSGATTNACTAFAFDSCAAIAAGMNDSRRCVATGQRGGSTSAAGSAALQNCRENLGATGQCEVIAAGCATGAPPSVGVWRPSSGPTQPPDDGVDRSLVGDEFGTQSTTGRSFSVTCTDDVYFEHAGNVVLPSVDIVRLPAEAGTVTLEYDAYDIPDRFVVEVDGQIRIDTQYVGSSSYTVSQVNTVLDHYGFRRTTQSSIHTPGRGSRSFQKSAGSTSAVVRIFAPLEGTAWEVRLKFQGSSCPGDGSGNGGGNQNRLYGSISFGFMGSDCSGGYAGGVVSNYQSESAANRDAIDLCQQLGGRGCQTNNFGSAYSGPNRCGALAYGTNSARCQSFMGTGDSTSAAESGALNSCRNAGYSCDLARLLSGGQASACTD